MSTLGTLPRLAGTVDVSASCSLPHVPLDIGREIGLDPHLVGWFSFARQKLSEIVALPTGITEGREVIAGALQVNAPRRAARAASPMVRVESVRPRSAPSSQSRRPWVSTCWCTASRNARHGAVLRRAAGRVSGHEPGLGAVLGHPLCPPADPCRRHLPAGPDDGEMGQLRAESDRSTAQGDAHWPVTMLAWSFVRDDQPLGDTARQVALALRDEVADLRAAGIRVIQVDEPALRETRRWRQADRADYLACANPSPSAAAIVASMAATTCRPRPGCPGVVGLFQFHPARGCGVEHATSCGRLPGHYRRCLGQGCGLRHDPLRSARWPTRPRKRSRSPRRHRRPPP